MYIILFGRSLSRALTYSTTQHFNTKQQYNYDIFAVMEWWVFTLRWGDDFFGYDEATTILGWRTAEHPNTTTRNFALTWQLRTNVTRIAAFATIMRRWIICITAPTTGSTKHQHLALHEPVQLRFIHTPVHEYYRKATLGTTSKRTTPVGQSFFDQQQNYAISLTWDLTQIRT